MHVTILPAGMAQTDLDPEKKNVSIFQAKTRVWALNNTAHDKKIDDCVGRKSRRRLYPCRFSYGITWFRMNLPYLTKTFLK